MTSEMVQQLRAAVRDVPDFPKAGIVFKDITPVLNDPVLFRASIDLFLERCRGRNIDKIVGIDARGFLFGSAVAYELGIGFVPIRKRGKLPYRTEVAKYSLKFWRTLKIVLRPQEADDRLRSSRFTKNFSRLKSIGCG